MTRLLAHIRYYVASILAALLLESATTPAHAAGSNMPWEQPLQQILQSIEGPVAKIMADEAARVQPTRNGYINAVQVYSGLISRDLISAAPLHFLSDLREDVDARGFL